MIVLAVLPDILQKASRVGALFFAAGAAPDVLQLLLLEVLLVGSVALRRLRPLKYLVISLGSLVGAILVY